LCSSHGESGLHLSAVMGHVDVLKIILENTTSRSELYLSNSEGKNALQLAVENGKLSVVNAIMGWKMFRYDCISGGR
jgi:ankyrin repeat protein